MSGNKNNSYSNLQNYYNNDSLNVPISRSYIPGSIVPSFGSLGYNSLQRNLTQSNGTGYYVISDAYDNCSFNNDEYRMNTCGGQPDTRRYNRHHNQRDVCNDQYIDHDQLNRQRHNRLNRQQCTCGKDENRESYHKSGCTARY